ncbi:MAG: hypothetical protein ACREQR_08900 [Candidatus Binataceae bacterium]
MSNPPLSRYRETLEALRAGINCAHPQEIIACRHVCSGVESSMAKALGLSHLEKTIWQFSPFVVTQLSGDGAPE